MAIAGSAWAQATSADRVADRAVGLARYRHAATYYALALRQVHQSSEPERQLDIWRRQRTCWERVVDLSPVPGERLAIPYADATLPGFFFPSRARASEPRPVVLVNNALASPTSHTWAHAGAAAAVHSYHPRSSNRQELRGLPGTSCGGWGPLTSVALVDRGAPAANRTPRRRGAVAWPQAA